MATGSAPRAGGMGRRVDDDGLRERAHARRQGLAPAEVVHPEILHVDIEVWRVVYGVEQKQRLKLVKFEPPPQRQKGIRVKDAVELVEALRKKGLV